MDIKKLLKNLIKSVLGSPKLSIALSYVEYHFVWPVMFEFFKLTTRMDKNAVLFADYYSFGLTDNMRPVYEKLKADGHYKLLTCFPSEEKSSKLKARFERSLQSIRFLKLFAQSGTLVLTESFLPLYAIKPRKNAKVIQLWHACGAFKKWGYSTLDKNFGASHKTIDKFPMHRNYTLVSVSSDEIIPKYMEAFNCGHDRVEALGAPRTDIYFDDIFVKNQRNELNLPKDKKVVLYAPTFRGQNINEAFCPDLNYKMLYKHLKDDFVILTKFHPYAKKKPDIPKELRGFAMDVTDVQIEKLLCAADILVTDYSSVIFEYALLDKPMIFYATDLDSYINERDFYYPYKDFIPGKLVTCQDDLKNALLELRDINYAPSEKVAAFRAKYMSACDGKSTERIVKWIKATS